MNGKVLIGVAFALAVLAAEAGEWSLTVGSAWRSRVKSSVSGAASGAGLAAQDTTTYDRDDPNARTEFSASDAERVQDPDYPSDLSFEKYAYTRTATRTVVTPNDGAARLDASDTDGPLGVKANLGYDFWTTERFSLGLSLKAAAYWKMRTAASGTAGGGTRTVSTVKDYYLFNGGPIPSDSDFTSFRPDADPYLPYRETSETTEAIAGRRISARFRSDLYQLGLGPQATLRVCDWIDVYGRVEALCNIAHLDFDVGASHRTDTQCLLGFGGTLGLVAGLTESLGLYAEIGYEWIEGAETSLGGLQAEVDYSSLVVSAGVVFTF